MVQYFFQNTRKTWKKPDPAISGIEHVCAFSPQKTKLFLILHSLLSEVSGVTDLDGDKGGLGNYLF